MKKPIEYRPMTDDEKLVVSLLKPVKFPSFTFDKRFAASLQNRMNLPIPTVSEAIAANLWRLLFRYRRQIKYPDRVRLFKLAEKNMTAPSQTRAARYLEQQRYKIKKMKEAAEANKQGKTLVEVFAEEARQQSLL